MTDLMTRGAIAAQEAVSSVAVAEADDVEPRLLTILGMVNEWLQFAETKNSGLVAITATGAAAFLAYISEKPDMSRLLLIGLLLSEALLVASLTVAMASFFPQSDLANLLVKDPGKPAENDNLFYFGHLAKYSPPVLADTIARQYAHLEHYDPARNKCHTDLAGQIIINSTIASTKYALFRVSTRLAFAAIIVAVIATVISLLLDF